MLHTIFSGGQTGADQGGLKAAKKCGFTTGGWLPKGCITQEGSRFEFIQIYGMKEHDFSGYPSRTEANVKDSDGTLRFASNFKSAGEKCTLKAIKWYNKPYLDINIKQPEDIANVINWIETNDIAILNIAGNSELTSPGISNFVENYVVELLCKYQENSR